MGGVNHITVWRSRRIVELLGQRRWATLLVIAQAVGLGETRCREILTELVAEGRVEQVPRGQLRRGRGTRRVEGGRLVGERDLYLIPGNPRPPGSVPRARANRLAGDAP